MTATAATQAPSTAAPGPLPALLAGKRLVITGVSTRRSIAFAVARLAQELGAEVVLTSYGRMRRIAARTAAQLDPCPEVLELDLTSISDGLALRAALAERWGRVDGVLHAVAYAPPDAIGGNFLATPRESAELALRISAYSLKALVEALDPLLHGGASVVAMDFDARRAWPAYDWMGVAKAALESIARYLARDLGPRGVRVNLVSSGPLKTLAASGVPSFDDLAATWTLRAPLGWDVDDAGVVAGPVCFLLSDLARGITGELLHVDGGFDAIAASEGREALLVRASP